MTSLGGEVLVAAAVTDAAWSPRVPLEAADWRRLWDNLETVREQAAEAGLRLALHPHAGTLVETAEDIEAVLEQGEPDWCLDTGHLAIGGADPVEFARSHAERIVHVHLKDVDMGLAEQVRSGELSLVEATRLGLFRPLGDGDASIDEVVGSARPPRVRALARARTGHDPHRGGAAGGSGSSARCSEEHRLSGHAGSSQRRRDSEAMRRVLHYVLAALLVLGLATFVAACGDDDDDGSSNKKDDVSLTQGRDLTIAVITHGEGDTFWSVAKKGAEQAGKDMGVTVKYSESGERPAEARPADRLGGDGEGRRHRHLGAEHRRPRATR